MASKPTERTLEHCRKNGILVTVVERYNSHTRRRNDAFGFGDLLAVGDQPTGALLIQACATCDLSKRRAKIITERADNARRWLEAGNRIEVWGWALRAKGGKRGARKVWTLRAVPVTLDTLQEAQDGKETEAAAGA